MSIADSNTQPPETEIDPHSATNLSHDELLDTYTRMREQCPVLHSSSHGGYYHIARYQGVRTVTTTPKYFSSAADGVLIPPVDLPAIPPLEFEGAEHGVWRVTMQAPMTPAEVRKLQPIMAAPRRRRVVQSTDPAVICIICTYPQTNARPNPEIDKRIEIRGQAGPTRVPPPWSMGSANSPHSGATGGATGNRTPI